MNYQQLLERTMLRNRSRGTLIAGDGLAVTLLKMITRIPASVWASLFYFRIMRLLEFPASSFSRFRFGDVRLIVKTVGGLTG